MTKIEKYSMPFGMLGVIAYVTHTTLGRILWKGYNPITTDISSLTAVGAPNRALLSVFTGIYGLAMLFFCVGLVMKAYRKYGLSVRIGYSLLLVMQVVSAVGYSLFPLSGDKTVMNVQNTMHIVVTVLVVATTVASGYFLAWGYLKHEKMKRLGWFIFVSAIVITFAGASNPIGMGLGLNILGLTERLVIYTLQGMLFVVSAYYTFGYRDENA
ncbi:MAG: DUF998 domain-containing protein [Cellulosilyticaceae bacterium]